MVEIPNEEYRVLSDRLKKLLVKLNQHLKLLEDMRKKAFELERLQKKKESFFYTSIFLLEFSQFTSLLTYLRDLDSKLDQYALETGKMRLAPLLPVVIYTAKAYDDYGATFVSENVREQTGYEPEDFIKDPKFWAEHLHPDDKKIVFAKLPCLVEKEHWAMEYRFKHKDQSYRFMFEEARMVYDNKGKPKEIVGYWTDITALKQAEEKLRASEEKWLSLTVNTDDTIMVVDNNDVIQYVNITIPPTTPEGVVGKSVYEYVSKEQHDVMRESLNKVHKTGKPDSYEVTLDMTKINPELGTLWFRTKVVPIKAEKGVSGVIMLATNITERKQAQKEKEDSEQRLKILFEEAPDAYFLGDLEGEFVDCNKAAERLTGYTKKEIIGKTLAELRLLPPDQIPVAFKARDEAIEHEITGLVEYTFNRKDRTQAKVEIKAHVVNLENKTFMLGIVRDITERKLREREVRIKDNTIKYSINAIVITDPKGNLEFINESFLRMWKYDNESDVLGKSVVEFWKNREKASRVIETLKEKGRWVGKLEAQGKDGSLFEVYVSASVATNKDGDPIGLTASFIDQEIVENILVSHS